MVRMFQCRLWGGGFKRKRFLLLLGCWGMRWGNRKVCLGGKEKEFGIMIGLGTAYIGLEIKCAKFRFAIVFEIPDRFCCLWCIGVSELVYV